MMTYRQSRAESATLHPRANRITYRLSVESLEARQLMASGPAWPLTDVSAHQFIQAYAGQSVTLPTTALAFTGEDDNDPDFPFPTPNPTAPSISSFSWNDPKGANDPPTLNGGGDWVDDGYADYQAGPGSFDITGTHTYKTPGTYTVTASVVYTGAGASAGQTLNLTATIVVSPVPAPSLSLSFSNPAPVKGQTFTLDATVTNNAPFSMTLPINYTYDIEPMASKGGGATQPPVTLAPGQTKTVDVYDFNVDWPWIPKTDPLQAFFGSIVNGVKGNFDFSQSSIYLTLASILSSAVAFPKSALAVTTVNEFLSDANTMKDDLAAANALEQAAVKSQNLVATTTITYDSAGDQVFKIANTTVTVPDAKVAWLRTFEVLDNDAQTALSGSVTGVLAAVASAGVAAGGITLPVALPAAAASAAAALNLLLAALAFEGAAQFAYTQAVDPPDPDYQVIPSATLGVGDQIASLISIDPQAAPSLDALAAYSGDLVAAASATNKSEGAANAGDLSWEAKQLSAAAGFEADSQVQLVQLAAGWPQASSLPAGLDKILADEGWTQAQIAQVDQAFAPGNGAPSSGGLDLQSALSDAQDLTNQYLQQAVSLNTGSLNQPVSPLSTTDTQALATDHAAALAAIAQGDPNGAAATATGAYVSEAVKVALATNNPATVQADLTSADTLLSSDIQQVIAAHPEQVTTTSMVSGGDATSTSGGGTTSKTGGGASNTTTGGATTSPTTPTTTTPTSRFVTSLYQDILGRLPEPSGLAAWTRTLNAGTRPAMVARSIWRSHEHRVILHDHPHGPHVSLQTALKDARRRSGLS